MVTILWLLLAFLVDKLHQKRTGRSVKKLNIKNKKKLLSGFHVVGKTLTLEISRRCRLADYVKEFY